MPVSCSCPPIMRFPFLSKAPRPAPFKSYPTKKKSNQKQILLLYSMIPSPIDHHPIMPLHAQNLRSSSSQMVQRYSARHVLLEPGSDETCVWQPGDPVPARLRRGGFAWGVPLFAFRWVRGSTLQEENWGGRARLRVREDPRDPHFLSPLQGHQERKTMNMFYPSCVSPLMS